MDVVKYGGDIDCEKMAMFMMVKQENVKMSYTDVVPKYQCVVCGATCPSFFFFLSTLAFHRERSDLRIVGCLICGYRQLFPLLSDEELTEVYDNDTTVCAMAPSVDFAAMRREFTQWTIAHVDMYWDTLQHCDMVLNIGSDYGFLKEELNKRPGRKFIIEGDDWLIRYGYGGAYLGTYKSYRGIFIQTKTVTKTGGANCLSRFLIWMVFYVNCHQSTKNFLLV